jgi:hypothetical protein
MKRMCLLTIVLAAAAGNLCASGILDLSCSYNVTGLFGPYTIPGTAIDNVDANNMGCFQTSFINTNALDSLNWGAPTEATGPSGLGPALLVSNSYQTTPEDPVSTRTATADDNQVSIQLAPNYQGGATAVYRVDDAALEWTGSSWYPTVFANPAVAGFQGHFNSVGPAVPPPNTPPGDSLIELTSGGPLELTFADSVSGVWFEIASLSGNANTLFVAEVQAFDGLTPIGTYTLTESGAYGSGGVCPSLANVPPTPCDDAPYVGFYDPEGRITSIYISVFNPSNLAAPIGFAIDSLEIDNAAVIGIPEPGMPLMIGGGLAALALYRRKRRSRAA